MAEDRSTVTPLRVRPGAVFRCHGDGLCCTDVHAFGPLATDEVEVLAALDPRVVVEHSGETVIVSTDEGRCVFRGPEGCELHRALGGAAKPRACQQFPFALIATPTGGRIATEHRCPCRTMGERSPIQVEDALRALGGRSPDRWIRDRLPMDEEVDLPFEEYETLEGPLLARLEAGQSPFEVLEVTPDLSRPAWQELGAAIQGDESSSRFGAALGGFGRAIQGGSATARFRWADVFDRAEQRSEEGDPDRIYRDWIADEIWSLRWAFFGSFRRARWDLANRLAAAMRVAESLPARPDRAAAEGVAAAELVALSEDYLTLMTAPME